MIKSHTHASSSRQRDPNIYRNPGKPSNNTILNQVLESLQAFHKNSNVPGSLKCQSPTNTKQTNVQRFYHTCRAQLPTFTNVKRVVQDNHVHLALVGVVAAPTACHAYGWATMPTKYYIFNFVPLDTITHMARKNLNKDLSIMPWVG